VISRASRIALAQLVGATMALGAAAPARGSDAGASEGGFADRLWAGIRRQLAAAVKPSPPVPVPVRWGLRQLGALDLGAPVLALAILDHGAGEPDELVVLTRREVVVLGAAGAGPIESRARFALAGAPAARQSRDPVGVLTVAAQRGRAEILARTSDYADGVRLYLRDGALVEEARLAGFPLCPGAAAELAGGRNFFVRGSLSRIADAAGFAVREDFYAAQCRSGLVDALGHPRLAFGVVELDGDLVVQRGHVCGAGAACDETIEQFAIPGCGTAFALTDVDNDGRLDVIAATAEAPGRGDRIAAFTWDGVHVLRTHQTKPFRGGVVGLAAGDLDGDGRRDVIAAVRLLGSNLVVLWALN
jgi:hypothetical protein